MTAREADDRIWGEAYIIIQREIYGRLRLEANTIIRWETDPRIRRVAYKRATQ